MSGRYIVIEGHDGTGKSTQVNLLADWLRESGREVVVVEEPGSDDVQKSTPVANELRRLIKNGSLERAPEISLGLFSASRREIWQQRIKPALERGAVVLSARNYLSTLVYQGYGEGVDQQEILRMTRIFTDERYLNPDVMLILTLGHQARAERIAMRGELKTPDAFESRSGDFQDRVGRGYLEIARQYRLPIIDADAPMSMVQSKILHCIKKTLAI